MAIRILTATLVVAALAGCASNGSGSSYSGSG
jgi:hypothetical protein